MTFAVAFGTPFLFYARSFFAHAWTAALLFLAWDLLRASRGGRRAAGAAGLARARRGFLAGWAPSPSTRWRRSRSCSRSAPRSPRRAALRPTFLSFAARRRVPARAPPRLQRRLLRLAVRCSSCARGLSRVRGARRHGGSSGSGSRAARSRSAYLFHPGARAPPLFALLPLGRSRASLGGGGTGGIAPTASSRSPRRSLTFLAPDRLSELARRLGARQPLPAAARLLRRARGRCRALDVSALARALRRGGRLLRRRARFSLTLSWPHFPPDFTWPAATGSRWFLARGWVAPNLGSLLGVGAGRVRSAPARGRCSRALAVRSPRRGRDALRAPLGGRRSARLAARGRAPPAARARPTRRGSGAPRSTGPTRAGIPDARSSRAVRRRRVDAARERRQAQAAWRRSSEPALTARSTISKTFQRATQRPPRRMPVRER